MINPKQYDYFKLFKEHIQINKLFENAPIIPRQLEIHLPGDHKRACNFNCRLCEGKILKKELFSYEKRAIALIRDIKGRIPYIIFGGIYSEPLLNPYLMKLIRETKKSGSFFGIHTNGSLLKKLEEEERFISLIAGLADSKEDYISISIDAGSSESHKKIKGTRKEFFSDIIAGLRMLSQKRKKNALAIRLTYLLSSENSSYENIKNIVELAHSLKVDSLRFSIPYDFFGRNLSEVRKYKKAIEEKNNPVYEKLLKDFISKDKNEKPFIFYMPPSAQDISKLNFKHCVYGFYQITIGTDGFVYRCSSTASPSFKKNRLGFIPESFEGLMKLIKKNQDINFNPSTCFSMGARCDRVGLTINYLWEEMNKSKKMKENQQKAIDEERK